MLAARHLDRLWVGLVGVPLAELATGLLEAWWAWPLLLLVAWSVSRSWYGYVLMALELGFIGVMWATVGIVALAHWPESRWLVGALWAAFPLALAGLGIVGRRRATWAGDYGSSVTTLPGIR